VRDTAGVAATTLRELLSSYSIDDVDRMIDGLHR